MSQFSQLDIGCIVHTQTFVIVIKLQIMSQLSPLDIRCLCKNSAARKLNGEVYLEYTPLEQK